MSGSIAVVGAGPGGLTAAMLLAGRGYRVKVFEKADRVGGRSAAITESGFSFDTGPTFLMMTFILREMFQEVGRNLDDYCTVMPLDPMYRLNFKDVSFDPSRDNEVTYQRIRDTFAGEESGYRKLLKRESVRYRYMYPCLQKPYGNPFSMLSPRLLRALPHLSAGRSLYSVLGNYFKNDNLRISFTFQAKYLGMSPWNCPGLYAMIPFIEHNFGVDHVKGGLSAISEAMARVIKEDGGEILTSTPVSRILTDGRGRATGVMLPDGSKEEYDAVVLNADFGYAAEKMFEEGVIRKWTPSRLDRSNYSCSTYMLYLGMDKIWDEPHHQIVLADDYRRNITEIMGEKILSEDVSVYVRNASVTDPTLAPDGHSALYVLVPVPNTRAPISWDDDCRREFRERVIARIADRTSIKDLEDHIVFQKEITPADWRDEYSIYQGATFNLGHNIRQMLYFRPHNRFEEVGNCYLVGGGTHPGSGLPTIYESARISSDLIRRDLPQ
ncbi:MAG: phytoene desaturase [Candidatus Fermentibacteraceae bacterium]|nr:phytoene desaturase [Candidatus Fermentibacteraceae bacterium]MBN2607891.1 phytoene desaturase [Candidatus Fermentibacteraceae bacterium]